MKLTHLSTLLAGFALASTANAGLILTGIVDGPRTGGTPKAIELYATSDIADLSIYGVSNASNGSASPGVAEFALSGSATAGQYLYVASESPEFTTFFGFAPTFVNGVANNNGDDAIELYESGSIIDVFGVVGQDGTGTPWDSVDGWAYRVDDTGPDGSTFVLANWTFSGIDALDGVTTNAASQTPFPIGTYSQTQIPEPSTVLMTLMAASAVGAVAMRRRLG
jgi:hypothetical protein